LILPDVNILIYAHRPESPDHAEYGAWLTRITEGDEPFACSELVLSAFVRVVTFSKAFRTPTPVDAAFSFISPILASPSCTIVRPGDRHFSIFEGLCRASNARGKLVADAYHAALAIEHGCEFVTTDIDFARFPGLRWSHPLHSRGARRS
jgi:uncharacterized protein